MTYSASALITASIQLTGFLVAYVLQTETFYDILGGLNYLTLALHSIFSNPEVTDRKLAMTVLLCISRLWLLVFLAWRAHERKGDARFDELKHSFARFLVAWVLQGLWVFLISMPMLFVNESTVSASKSLTQLDMISLIGFAFGIALEIAADVQKAIWVKDGRPGGFCQAGVWGYSRHPNYFGEMLQWWSAFAFAFSSGSGLGDAVWWCCIISPVFTMQILLFTSGTGVANAEGKNLKRYYDKWPKEYDEYRQKTSVLMPMVGYGSLPMFLKRSIFLDFDVYEYKPKQEGKKE